jgi:hypothetical protein
MTANYKEDAKVQGAAAKHQPKTNPDPPRQKADFPPLLEPGLHIFDEQGLRATFVDPFPGSQRRLELLTRFLSLTHLIRSLRLDSEAWIDGSFVTTKPDPDDLDVVFFFDRSQIDNLPSSERRTLDQLNNRSLMLVRYFCDVYYDPADDQARRDYWLNKFGLGYGGPSRKGIAVFRIENG